MTEDIFFDLKGNISEFTDNYFVDYERETILLEVHPDYLDEIFKIINADFLGLDIVFVKSLKSDLTTIVACVPHFYDSFISDLDEDSSEYDY